LAALREEQLKRVLVGLPPEGSDEQISDLWQVDPSVSEAASFSPEDPCPVVPPLSIRCHAIDALRTRLTSAAAALRALTPGPAAPAPVAPAAPDAGRDDLIAVVEGIQNSADDLGEKKVNLLETQQAINRRHARMVLHAAHLETLIPTTWFSLVTTDGNFATRRTWYQSADMGLAVGVSINEILPYVGTNLYFRPVNTEAPPGKFLTRFSGLIGFTWTDNILKPGERASLYGTSVSLVLGAGLRLTEVLKVSGGVLTFKGIDPNPTVVKTRIEVAPFVSISGDFDVAKLLGGLFGADATAPKTLGAGTPPD
jgi:hypothetical protein